MRLASALLPLAVAAAAFDGAPRPALVRESALPLAGKRVLLHSPRAEVAELASALVLAGARPIWCPLVRVNPLEDYAELDDALMRLAEYDVLIVLSTQSIDSLAERWLALADGNQELVGAMLDASSVEVGAVGTDAVHFRQALGVPPTVVPIEPSARALGATLADLGHVKPGAKVLVASALAMAPLGDPPSDAAGLLAQLEAYGADTDRVCTHALATTPPSEIAPELQLLRDGLVDAVCVGSAEEARVVLGEEGWLPAGAPPLVVALGGAAAAAARDAAAGRDDAVDLLALGARTGERAIVDALEEHFGGGRLLF